MTSPALPAGPLIQLSGFEKMATTSLSSWSADRYPQAQTPEFPVLALGIKMRAEGLPNISEKISSIAEDADLDEDPESHFEIVTVALDALEAIVFDGDALEEIKRARRKISEEVDNLRERKEARDSEKEDETDWSQISSVAEEVANTAPKKVEARPRSIFDDVDR